MIEMKRMRRRRARMVRFIIGLILSVALILVAVYFIFRVPEQVPQINYPMRMVDEIREYADEYDLDPARVAAVIYCESSFRTEAVSEVGARGLMQIMPTTGEWLATKFPDIEYTSPEQLFDPDTNMKFGCWYLNYLDGRFSGDLAMATAAYHAGQGTVDKWLENAEYSTDGATLIGMPAGATATYVNRVVAAYEGYKVLYGEAAKALPNDEG